MSFIFSSSSTCTLFSGELWLSVGPSVIEGRLVALQVEHLPCFNLSPTTVMYAAGLCDGFRRNTVRYSGNSTKTRMRPALLACPIFYLYPKLFHEML